MFECVKIGSVTEVVDGATSGEPVTSWDEWNAEETSRDTSTPAWWVRQLHLLLVLFCKSTTGYSAACRNCSVLYCVLKLCLDKQFLQFSGLGFVTSRSDFIVPRFNRQLSNSSFSVAAPSAWNRLPSDIRTLPTYTLFLTRLKTHLFAESLLWCDTVMLLYFYCISGAPELWMWGAIASSCWLIDWLIDTGHRTLLNLRRKLVVFCAQWNAVTERQSSWKNWRTNENHWHASVKRRM